MNLLREITGDLPFVLAVLTATVTLALIAVLGGTWVIQAVMGVPL